MSADEEAARRGGVRRESGFILAFTTIGDYEQRLGPGTRLLADMKLGTTRTGGDIGDIRWDLGYTAAALGAKFVIASIGARTRQAYSKTGTGPVMRIPVVHLGAALSRATWA